MPLPLAKIYMQVIPYEMNGCYSMFPGVGLQAAPKPSLKATPLQGALQRPIE